MGITFASAIQHMSKTADCHSSTNMHAFIEFSSQYHSVDPTMPLVELHLVLQNSIILIVAIIIDKCNQNYHGIMFVIKSQKI